MFAPVFLGLREGLRDLLVLCGASRALGRACKRMRADGITGLLHQKLGCRADEMAPGMRPIGGGGKADAEGGGLGVSAEPCEQGRDGNGAGAFDQQAAGEDDLFSPSFAPALSPWARQARASVTIAA
ncbi:hypothetical protein QWZ10_06430 [Paracoccus cavernae]|uniref:Uncharacterized protein n=1 Tax=Paracoccus cavernae TaxID=1571207 RepID=A0ABT8D811_9RHOB|nr:hypothetical protein [Paracoccus cavernae]